MSMFTLLISALVVLERDTTEMDDIEPETRRGAKVHNYTPSN
jgi:hypothetical protein